MTQIVIINKEYHEKIKDEYINFMGIFQRINNIYFIDDYKLRSKLFIQLFQFILEDRILYRYKIKKPPYHGYNTIEEDEYSIIDYYFKDKKEYLERKGHYGEIYEKLDNIKKFFIDTINNKKTLFKNMYSDEDNKISVTDVYVKYRKIKIPLDPRLHFLLSKMGAPKFLRMILRYIGYGITGQHCAIPFNVYEYLHSSFGIKGEGFSSPLNSKLITLPDTVFCTLFKDTDKYAGSQGPFSHKILVKNSDKNWTVNPPYMPILMLVAYKEVMKAFKKIERKDFLVIVLIPKWEEDEAYKKFKTCRYLVKLIEPPEGKHYMNCNGKTVYMNGVVNSMFFLCRDKSVVQSDKIDKMLELWNTYYSDKVNQSNFISPQIDNN
jgi:hypothetical protein